MKKTISSVLGFVFFAGIFAGLGWLIWSAWKQPDPGLVVEVKMVEDLPPPAEGPYTNVVTK